MLECSDNPVQIFLRLYRLYIVLGPQILIPKKRQDCHKTTAFSVGKYNKLINYNINILFSKINPIVLTPMWLVYWNLLLDAVARFLIEQTINVECHCNEFYLYKNIHQCFAHALTINNRVYGNWRWQYIFNFFNNTL